MSSIQRRIWLERAGLSLESDYLIEAGGLHGSISGPESYKAISHFKSYVAPYLPKDKVKDAKEKMHHFGNVSKIEDDHGKHADEESSHELNSKHNEHASGTKIKVHGVHKIDVGGKIHLDTSHGVIPQSKLKKPESLKKENKSSTGFDVEGRIAKHLGSKPAGSTGSAYDFSYGKKSNGDSVVKGKTKVIGESPEPTKSLKKDEKPVAAGESKLTNVKMGAGGLKHSPTKGWSFTSRHKEFEKHVNKHARVNQGDGTSLGLIEHLNKHHPDGHITKGFSTTAPKGSARSYFSSIGANVLHIHDKKTDKGTAFTVGDKNELKGKTKLGHLSNKHMDEHLDGKLTVEATKTGSSSLFHRPNESKMKKLANLSSSDSKHKDLTNSDHAEEFKKDIDNHISSTNKNTEK
jgi:hypothetical protein